MDDFAQNFAQNRADWYVNSRGPLECQGVSGSSKNSHKRVFFSQLSTVRA